MNKVLEKVSGFVGWLLGKLPVFYWATRATKYLPKTTPLGKETTYDYGGKVIIIGAGAAGLAAARVCHENKIPFTVLEATERYGGRVMADRTLAEFPVDLGAEWIHNSPNVLNVISGSATAATETETIPYLVKPAFRWNGRKLVSFQYFMEFLGNFMPESKFKRSTWFDFVDRHFALDGVVQNIHFNSPVATVDYSKDRVIITTVGGKRFTADRVLMTTPIGVLQSGDIQFVPSLSEKRKQAIASVDFLPGFKIMMKFSEKFYPGFVFMFNILGSQKGEKGFYDAAFRKESSDNVVSFLCTGDHTKKYYALPSEKDILDAFLVELDEIFDGAASKAFTGEYRFEDWGRKEFTKGSWVEGYKVSDSTRKELNKPLKHKVYFGGEAHDISHQMGVPGAILSGLDAMDRLLRSSD